MSRGSLPLLLAPVIGQIVRIDADEGMISQARLAAQATRPPSRRLGRPLPLWEKYGAAWGWPPEHMTLEQDREDLACHEREIAALQSFNYAVLNADETQLLGCVYIDAPEQEGTDALVSWWVIDSQVGSVLEAELADFVPWWVITAWPFGCPQFAP